MMNKCYYFPILLLLLLSCKENKSEVVIQKAVNTPRILSGNSTVSINFDSVIVLNFGDYFSKIEIIPLEMANKEKFYCSTPTYIVIVDGLWYSLKIGEKGYTIRQSPWPAKFFFDKNGHFIRGGIPGFPSEEDTISIPKSVTLNYNGKTVMSRTTLYEMNWDDRMKILLDNHYVFPVEILQGNQFLCVVTESMERTYLSFYNKKTNRTTTGIDLFSNGLILPDTRVMKNGILYGMVDPWFLNSAIDTCFMTDESKKRLSEIHTGDNAVIVKYYAK